MSAPSASAPARLDRYHAGSGGQRHVDDAARGRNAALFTVRAPFDRTLTAQAVDAKGVQLDRARVRPGWPLHCCGRMTTTLSWLMEREDRVQAMLDLALHGQQAVALPVDVGELGDDVAATVGCRRMVEIS